jgi:hypothetical protein
VLQVVDWKTKFPAVGRQRAFGVYHLLSRKKYLQKLKLTDIPLSLTVIHLSLHALTDIPLSLHAAISEYLSTTDVDRLTDSQLSLHALTDIPRNAESALR